MSEKEKTGKHKTIKFAGYIIRERARKEGISFQVDMGQRNGKHVRRSFKTMREAKLFAQRTRGEVQSIGNRLWHLTDKQRRDAVEALDILSGSGVTLTDAAELYKKNPKMEGSDATLSHLAEVYLAEKQAQVDREEIREQTIKHSFLTS